MIETRIEEYINAAEARQGITDRSSFERAVGTIVAMNPPLLAMLWRSGMSKEASTAVAEFVMQISLEAIAGVSKRNLADLNQIFAEICEVYLSDVLEITGRRPG